MFQHVKFSHSYQAKKYFQGLWYGYDSEQLWSENLADPERRAMLERSGWLEPQPAITYTYNYHGFRDEDFDDRPCGMALGCSFTEGFGVTQEQTWPWVLGEMVGHKVWNFGIGGTGIDTCYRIMEFWIPLLKPRFVAMLDPPIPRIEICAATGKFTTLLNLGWEHSDVTSPQDQFIKNWFAQAFNWLIQHRKHVLAMRMLAQDHGIPFVHLYHGPICQPDPDYQRRAEFFPDNDLGILDRARDLAHAGPRTLRLTAEKLYDQLRDIHAV